MPWEADSGLLSVGGTWLSHTKIPITLHQETAYVATPDRVLVFDTTKGAVTNVITPEAKPLTELTRGSRNDAAPPVVTGGSAPQVLASFLVRRPGVGTQAARDFIEFVAADTATGKTAWRLPLTIPTWTKDVLEPLNVSVVGTAGDVAVVTVRNKDTLVQSASTTYGIDLTTHRLRWTRDMFDASVVTEGMVTGEVRSDPLDDYSSAAGFDLATGTEKWRGQERINLELQPAGRHLVLAQALDKSDIRKSIPQFLDPATGAVKQDLPEATSRANCRHDGASTVVCAAGHPDPFVIAFDATSGAALWQLPDETAGRLAPRVTAVWHGRIYGKTDDGPLALDARTGADLPIRPGITPDLVNGYTGLAISPSGDDLTAYPSTG